MEPHPDAIQLIGIADLLPTLSGADPAMLANVGHYLRGLSDRVKGLPVARTGPLRVAAEAVSAPVQEVPSQRTASDPLRAFAERCLDANGGMIKGIRLSDEAEKALVAADNLPSTTVEAVPWALLKELRAGINNLASMSWMYDRKEYAIRLKQKITDYVATQAEPSPGMSKSWQTAVAVAREAPSGRTVVDSAVILAIDKRLSEAFVEVQQAREDFTAMKALTESGATEIARLTAELQEAREALQAADAEKAAWMRMADSFCHAQQGACWSNTVPFTRTFTNSDDAQPKAPKP
jgi:hypothetical protein